MKNNNQKSGSHDEFHEVIMGTAWILYYHEQMEETGNDSSLYFNLENPRMLLPSNVFMSSDDGVTEAPRRESYRSKKNEMNGTKLERDQSCFVDHNQYYQQWMVDT